MSTTRRAPQAGETACGAAINTTSARSGTQRLLCSEHRSGTGILCYRTQNTTQNVNPPTSRHTDPCFTRSRGLTPTRPPSTPPTEEETGPALAARPGVGGRWPLPGAVLPLGASSEVARPLGDRTPSPPSKVPTSERRRGSFRRSQATVTLSTRPGSSLTRGISGAGTPRLTPVTQRGDRGPGEATLGRPHHRCPRPHPERAAVASSQRSEVLQGGGQEQGRPRLPREALCQVTSWGSRFPSRICGAWEVTGRGAPLEKTAVTLSPYQRDTETARGGTASPCHPCAQHAALSGTCRQATSRGSGLEEGSAPLQVPKELSPFPDNTTLSLHRGTQFVLCWERRHGAQAAS